MQAKRKKIVMFCIQLPSLLLNWVLCDNHRSNIFLQGPRDITWLASLYLIIKTSLPLSTCLLPSHTHLIPATPASWLTLEHGRYNPAREPFHIQFPMPRNTLLPDFFTAYPHNSYRSLLKRQWFKEVFPNYPNLKFHPYFPTFHILFPFFSEIFINTWHTTRVSYLCVCWLSPQEEHRFCKERVYFSVFESKKRRK